MTPLNPANSHTAGRGMATVHSSKAWQGDSRQRPLLPGYWRDLGVYSQ